MRSKYILPTIFILLVFYAVSARVSYLNDYQTFKTGADEGNYYRQAVTVKDSGLHGFNILAKSFISDQKHQVFPSPIRIAYVGIAAILLNVNDNMNSLAYVSLASYLLLIILVLWFSRKYFGTSESYVIAIMLLLSPLFSGLSTRVLPDALFTLMMVASLLFFIEYLIGRNIRFYWAFLVCFTTGLLVKETAILFLPFFIVSHYIFDFKKGLVDWKPLFSTIIIPPIAYFLTLWLAFGSVPVMTSVFSAIIHVNLGEPHSYNLLYHSGPWYQPLMDFMMLSPLVLILFLLYIGKAAMSLEKIPSEQKLLITFTVYIVFVLAFLPKNIRYALPIDFVLRIGTALFLFSIAKKYVRMNLGKFILALLVTTIIVSDVDAYNRFYFQDRIYDPIAFNLLRSEKIIPSDKLQQVNDHKPFKPTKGVKALLDKSLQHYSNREFEQSITVAIEALKKDSLLPQAWNIICSAYNEQKNWDKAIEAGERALEIDPNFQLARNNLNWALSRKKMND